MQLFYPPLKEAADGSEQMASLELDSYTSASVQPGQQVNYEVCHHRAII